MNWFNNLKYYKFHIFILITIIISATTHAQNLSLNTSDHTQGIQGTGIIESFDDINTLQVAGWIFDNRSDFPTKVNWFQGIESIFPAQSGAATSYIANTTASGNNLICNWLIMPDIGAIDQLSFYTRSDDIVGEVTRMLVMYSPTGSTNTGACEGVPVKNGVADFSDFQQLLAINPNQDVNGYPQEWSQYTVDVNGNGRIAFLYYVTNTGAPTFNSGLLAIDTVSHASGAPPLPPPAQAQLIPLLNIYGLFILLIIFMFAGFVSFKFNRRVL